MHRGTGLQPVSSPNGASRFRAATVMERMLSAPSQCPPFYSRGSQRVQPPCVSMRTSTASLTAPPRAKEPFEPRPFPLSLSRQHMRHISGLPIPSGPLPQVRGNDRTMRGPRKNPRPRWHSSLLGSPPRHAEGRRQCDAIKPSLRDPFRAAVDHPRRRRRPLDDHVRGPVFRCMFFKLGNRARRDAL